MLRECAAVIAQRIHAAFPARSPGADHGHVLQALLYFRHFRDAGIEVGIGGILHAVLRDALQTRRMDRLTLQPVQRKEAERRHHRQRRVRRP
ncbi:MAG TPA: hypothetical protein PLP53_06620 [Plasticicumulans sp.]|nr:hypothetical protein [Plasticicumulans sp.]HNE01639.1 hypothetical protein [Plasticicumulans sp.]